MRTWSVLSLVVGWRLEETCQTLHGSVPDGREGEGGAADWTGEEADTAASAHEVAGVALVYLGPHQQVPTHRALQAVL